MVLVIERKPDKEWLENLVVKIFALKA